MTTTIDPGHRSEQIRISHAIASYRLLLTLLLLRLDLPPRRKIRTATCSTTDSADWNLLSMDTTVIRRTSGDGG